MSTAKWLLVCLLLGLLLVGFVGRTARADDDDDDDDDDDEDAATTASQEPVVSEDDDDEDDEESAGGLRYRVGHEDVIIRHVFADYPDRKFPVGAVVDVVFGLFNQNDELHFNISQAYARLTSPTDFDQVFFNFTGFEYGNNLAPGAESSILYKFRSDPSMDPREFGLVVDIIYNIGSQVFVHTGFNGTIEFVDSSSSFIDVQGLFAYLMLLAIFGGLGFLVYRMASPKQSKRKATAAAGSPSSPSAEKGTVEGGADMAFVDPATRKALQKGNSTPKGSASKRKPTQAE